MRIAHICQWFIPGLSYQENFLPQEQAKLGNDVWILTSDRVPPRLPASETRFPAGLYEEDSVHIRRLPSIMPLKNRGQVFLCDLHSALKKINPDVVHIHGLWFLPTFQVMARDSFRSLTSRPLMVDDHSDNGNLPTGPGNIVRFGFARWVCKRIVGKGGKVFSVNPFSRWFVTEVLGAKLEGVHFLPLGINTRTFYPDLKRKAEGRKKTSTVPGGGCFYNLREADSKKGVRASSGSVRGNPFHPPSHKVDCHRIRIAGIRKPPSAHHGEFAYTKGRYFPPLDV